MARAVTGAASSVVGRVCSKIFKGTINMKEVAISAIGGAAGGAFFGGCNKWKIVRLISDLLNN